MSYNFNWRRFVAVAAALLLATAGTAMAQQTSGNLFVSVVDDQGAALPGVTVTMTGQGAPQVNVTNAQGQVRFLGLAPGSGYQVTAELEGFSTIEYPNIAVNVGRNSTIQLQVSPAVEETITVTSESPLLDERKVSTGTTVTSVELEKIPTARDPWVVLQSVPGVLVDRVNVGGNESGQQSNFIGNGSGRASASWSVDGVVITDPAARGASPSYYNFDAFEEMAISTGGSDISALTGGVQLNLVTKRGTNSWRVSGRYLVTDNDWQSDPDVDSGALGQAGEWNNFNAQSPITQTSSTDSVDDYGIDFGGPLVKDRLWIWGTYGVQDIKAFQLGSGAPVPDDTELESYAAKINAQITNNNSGILFYHYGDKAKNGRGAGATRPQETTWNQTGPTDIYKVEDTHIFNSNLYITGLASYVGGGFALAPIGGLGTDNAQNIVWDQGGVWHNSFFGYSTVRPQEQAKVDGSYFFNTGNTNHELKFGVGYRHNEVESFSSYPGQGLVGLARFGSGYGNGSQFLGVAYHDIFTSDEFDQVNVLLQDTITWGNATVNVGIRYDSQQPENGVAPQPAARLAAIPAFTRSGGDPGFEWETISPRIGVTYALGEERATLLRASYARFADQLGTGFFADLGVNVQQYQYFYWTDTNGDNVIDPGSIQLVPGIIGDRTVIANQVDPGLDPALTDELVVGIEHALLPEFVIGVQATIRQNSDGIVTDPLVVENGVTRPHQRSDYALVGSVQGTLPTGAGFNEPVYALRSGVTRDPARGFLRSNSDLESDFLGVNFTFNKRLSNRWLLRGFVNFSDWTYEGRTPGDIQDPTRAIGSTNGDQVLVQSAGSGSKSEVWISSTWSANVSGLYQIAPDRPWGFNVSADVNLREGFAVPYRTSVGSRSSFTGDTFARTVLVAPETDSFRNDDVVLVNARVEKEFSFSDFGLTVGIDAFNLFNNNDTLQTEGIVSSRYVNADGTQFGSNGSGLDFSSTNSDFIRETISPRIFRVGVRFSFN